MMNKVFISYSSADSEVASRLRTALEGIEVSGWLDHSDIAAGDAIAAKVKEALQQAGALIVLVSPRSLESKWVQFEVGAAYAMEKPIIPIIVGHGRAELDLPEWLEGFLYIDARNRPIEEVASEIGSAISNSKID